MREMRLVASGLLFSILIEKLHRPLSRCQTRYRYPWQVEGAEGGAVEVGVERCRWVEQHCFARKERSHSGEMYIYVDMGKAFQQRRGS